ncbi:unnamed protein product, partial [Ectocarpus sp. 12 AP-2014]
CDFPWRVSSLPSLSFAPKPAAERRTSSCLPRVHPLLSCEGWPAGLARLRPHTPPYRPPRRLRSRPTIPPCLVLLRWRRRGFPVGSARPRPRSLPEIPILFASELLRASALRQRWRLRSLHL